MKFTKKAKKENNPDGNIYAVYMTANSGEHYVCDMIDNDESVAVNELGLTLRARLTRSNGKYAMLEGTIFNPTRLINAACKITDYNTEDFTGGEFKQGYTLLTVTADRCVNKYMIFCKSLLNTLLLELKQKK